MMRRFWLPAAVLLAVAVVYLAAWRTQGPAQRAAQPAGQVAAVTSISRSCPPSAGTGAAKIAMVAMPAQAPAAKAGTAASATGGSATFSAVPAAAAAAKPSATASPTGTAAPTGTASPSSTASTPAAKPTSTTQPRPVTVAVPGTATTVAAPGGATGGTAVSVTGQLAEGFEAEQVDQSGTGLVSCTHPESDMWFIGTGEAAGASDIRLYLMNTGTITATVDVTILTDTGQQNGMNNAITVPPHQVLTESVAPFVRGSLALALHVQTSSGQVAASVWEGDGNGNGAWLPQAGPPSTTLVLPGLTVARSAPRLFIAVPGGTDSRFNVVAYTAGKVVQVFGSTQQDASADATAPYPLTSLGASAAGLKLTSNVPIVAGVLVPGNGIGSFTTAAAPITDQGVVAGNPSVRGVTVGLLLTAPAGTASATVTVVGADGIATPAGGAQAVTVQAGHTLAVAVPRPPGTRQPFAIVITPKAGSGPLYAVRVVTSGTGGLSAPVSSLLPVLNAPTAIPLPPVQNSYTAVIPLSCGGTTPCTPRHEGGVAPS